MRRRWYSTKEAAEFLGVHPNTVRNWADSGKLPAHRTSGNQRRFDPEELSRHALSGGRSAGTVPPAVVTPPEGQRALQREHYLSALVESAAVASSHGAFGDVCAELARAAGDALGAASVDVFTCVPETDRLEFVGGWQVRELHPSEWRVGARIAVSDHWDWVAVRDGSDGVIIDCRDPAIEQRERDLYAHWDEVSALTVPLRHEGATIGVMDAQSRDEQRIFDEDDLRFAKVVAGHVATVLVSARLLANERARATQMEALLAIATAVNSTVGLPESLGMICREMGMALSADVANLYTYDERGDEMVRVAHWERGQRGAGKKKIGGRYPPRQYGSWRQALEAGRPVVVDRRATRGAAVGDTAGGQAVSWVTVPLYRGGRLRGLVDVYSRDATRVFSEHDVAFAGAVARQVETALSGSELVEHARHRSEQLEEVLEATRAMNAPLDPREVIAEIVVGFGRSLGVSGATLYEVADDGAALSVALSYFVTERRPDEAFVGEKLELRSYPRYARAVSEGKPAVINPLMSDALTLDERALVQRFHVQGCLVVPMIGDGRVIGLLEASETRHPRWFSSDDIRTADIFAAQAVTAISRARAYANEAERSGDMALLLRTSSAMAGSLELGAAMFNVCRACGEALDFTYVTVYGWDEARGRFEAHVSYYADEPGLVNSEFAGEVFRAEDEPVMARVVGEKASFATATRDDPRLTQAERDAMESYGVGSWLYVPMVFRDEAVGLMEIDFREEGHVFSEREITLTQAIANQAAVVLVNVRLYEQVKRSRDEAWILSEIVAAVGATLDVSEVLRQAVHGMHRVTDFDAVGFWFLSESGLEAEVVAAEGDAVAGPPQVVSRDPDSPAWRAIETARTVSVSDVAASPIPGLDRIRSVLAIPLSAEGRAVGAVVVGSEDPGHFGESTVMVLEQCVAPVGVALQNARLYERIRKLHLSNLQALSTALNVKDSYMHTHAPRTAVYAGLLCRRLGYGDDDAEQVEQAAYLHDIGRIGVPDHVLQKPDALNEREWSVVRGHAAASADIIKPIFSEDLYLAVRHHHERIDGGGYPDGVPAAALPLATRILAVADAYDAMTTSRPYARALTYPQAVAELRRCAGSQFDPELCEAFVDLLEELAVKRRLAEAAAAEAAAAMDWRAHGSLRSAGGSDRDAYPLIEQTLQRAREAHPGVARLFTVVPGERGYVLATGTAAAGQGLGHPGDPVLLPAEMLETDAPSADGEERNAVHVDAYGTWASGFVPVVDGEGRLTAVVEADVPVETAVRGGVAAGDAGETLDSILRQAAARMTRIEAAANTDGLTGLSNHRYLQERLGQELARARSHGEKLGLLFADLDHFKDFNDAAGHPAGDEALRGLARILKRELRRIDVPARYGGDEFTIILPDTDRTGAAEVAERVRHAVEREGGAVDGGNRAGDGDDARDGRLTISIGSAVFPDDAGNAADLVDKADWAMYRAKRAGRNRVEVYEAEAAADAGDEGVPAAD